MHQPSSEPPAFRRKSKKNNGIPTEFSVRIDPSEYNNEFPRSQLSVTPTPISEDMERIKAINELSRTFDAAEREADAKIDELKKWFKVRKISYPNFDLFKDLHGYGAFSYAEEHLQGKHSKELASKQAYIRELTALKEKLLAEKPHLASNAADPKKDLDIFESETKQDKMTITKPSTKTPYKPAKYTQREFADEEEDDRLREQSLAILGQMNKKPPSKSSSSKTSKGSGMMGRFKVASSLYPIAGRGEEAPVIGYAIAPDARRMTDLGMDWNPNMSRNYPADSAIGHATALVNATNMPTAAKARDQKMQRLRELMMAAKHGNGMCGGNPAAAAALDAAPKIIDSVGDASAKLADSIGNQVDQAKRTDQEIAEKNGANEARIAENAGKRRDQLRDQIAKLKNERFWQIGSFAPGKLDLKRFGINKDLAYRYEHAGQFGIKALTDADAAKFEAANDALEAYVLKSAQLNDNYETRAEENSRKKFESEMKLAAAALTKLKKEAGIEDDEEEGAGKDEDESSDGKLHRAYMQKLFNTMQVKRHEMGNEFPAAKLALQRFGMFHPKDVADPASRRLLGKADEALSNYVLKKYGNGAYSRKHTNMYGEKHVFRGHGEPWYAETTHDQAELKTLFPNPDQNMNVL